MTVIFYYITGVLTKTANVKTKENQNGTAELQHGSLLGELQNREQNVLHQPARSEEQSKVRKDHRKQKGQRYRIPEKPHHAFSE